MDLITIAIFVFAALESANILMLYFFPGTRLGNGMGVFDAYEKSKSDPELYPLVNYLVNWVAGTKLIFILLLIIIAVLGDHRIKLFSAGAMILSITTFYWRLYPIIRSLDKDKRITPPGYSRTLAIMIAGFIGIFVIAFAVSFI